LLQKTSNDKQKMMQQHLINDKKKFRWLFGKFFMLKISNNVLTWICQGSKVMVHYESVILDPTLLSAKLDGNSFCNRWMAFQPVQCMGINTSGSNFLNSAIVLS